MTDNELSEEMLLDFFDGVEAGIASARQRYKEKKGLQEPTKVAAVREETFTLLAFREHQGAKLGPFGIAASTENDADKFNYALGILEKNGSTIEHRYHGEGYVFSYWNYQGLIYRQKLKERA